MNFSQLSKTDLIEHLPEALFLEDREGNILDVNSETCEMLGYSKEELLNEHASTIVPDQVKFFPPEEISQRMDAGEPIETVNLCKDGTEVPVELRGQVVNINGESLIMISLRDISKRKDKEDRLRQFKWVVEGSNDLMSACGSDYRYLFANRAYREFYDLPEEEISGRKLTEVIGENTFEKIVKPRIDRSLNGEVVKFELNRTNPAQVKRTFSIIYYPLNWRKRNSGVVSVMRDITKERKAEHALHVERNKLRNLHDAVDLLEKQETEADVLQTAVQVAEDVLEFDICVIDMLEGDYLITRAVSSGLDFADPDRFKVGEGIAGRTVQGGKTIWGDDVREHPDAKPTSDTYRAYISVPIGELGVLQIVSTERGSFNERDVELAEILTNHILERIGRVRLEEKLREQAIRNPLTHLFNRRYFNEALSKAVERAERYRTEITFLMLDINRFKEINDRYSHQAGDEVLRVVADILAENVRSADTVVRFGGDEFLVMMPNTDGLPEDFQERLCGEIDRWDEESSLIDFPLSLSIGSSRWHPDQNMDVEESIKEADIRMYRDKLR